MELDMGKLFVGGLSWETSEDILIDHFNQYGEVLESVIMRDKFTGRTRGFGFIQFSEPSVAEKVLQLKHVINNKSVEVKRAVPRGENRHNQNHQNQQSNGFNTSNGGDSEERIRSKKIFVGGLPANLTEAEFRTYFEKYGNITDLVVMYDNYTGRPRGFGFITFDSEEVVEQVLENNYHELQNKQVEVKRAVPRQGNNGNHHNGNNNSNNGYNGGRGMYFNGAYPGGMYPPFYPYYGYFRGYPGSYPYSMYGPGYGYPMGGGIGYGAGATSPWSGYGGDMMSYGNSGVYNNNTMINGDDEGYYGEGNLDNDSSIFVEDEEDFVPADEDMNGEAEQGGKPPKVTDSIAVFV